VIVAEGECQLERQRRLRPQVAARLKAGKRVVRTRFGVDEDVCSGDHSCIRLSGCPSLTVKTSSDPLKLDPVAHVNNGCVGCGLCGRSRTRGAVPLVLPRRDRAEPNPWTGSSSACAIPSSAGSSRRSSRHHPARTFHRTPPHPIRDCDPAAIVYFPRFLEMANDLVEDWFETGLSMPFGEFHFSRGWVSHWSTPRWIS